MNSKNIFILGAIAIVVVAGGLLWLLNTSGSRALTAMGGCQRYQYSNSDLCNNLAHTDISEAEFSQICNGDGCSKNNPGSCGQFNHDSFGAYCDNHSNNSTCNLCKEATDCYNLDGGCWNMSLGQCNCCATGAPPENGECSDWDDDQQNCTPFGAVLRGDFIFAKCVCPGGNPEWDTEDSEDAEYCTPSFRTACSNAGGNTSGEEKERCYCGCSKELDVNDILAQDCDDVCGGEESNEYEQKCEDKDGHATTIDGEHYICMCDDGSTVDVDGSTDCPGFGNEMISFIVNLFHRKAKNVADQATSNRATASEASAAMVNTMDTAGTSPTEEAQQVINTLPANASESEMTDAGFSWFDTHWWDTFFRDYAGYRDSGQYCDACGGGGGGGGNDDGYGYQGSALTQWTCSRFSQSFENNTIVLESTNRSMVDMNNGGVTRTPFSISNCPPSEFLPTDRWGVALVGGQTGDFQITTDVSAELGPITPLQLRFAPQNRDAYGTYQVTLRVRVDTQQEDFNISIEYQP